MGMRFARRSFLCLGLWLAGESLMMAEEAEGEREKLLRGGLLLQKGKTEQALAVWGSLLNEEEVALRAQLGMAIACREAERYGTALVAYQGVLQRSSELLKKEALGWQVRCHLEIGHCYEQVEKLEFGAKAYGQVLGLTDKDEAWTAHRCLARLGLARCLASLERTQEAIEILTDSLPEMEATEWRGWRTRQMAQLARYYHAVGERDWAVTILERLKEDPEVAERFFHRATRWAEDQVEPDTEPRKLRVYRTAEGVEVVMPGQFELRFRGPAKDRRNSPGGGVFEWYHTVTDPFCTTDLSARSLPLVSMAAGSLSERSGQGWMPMRAEVRQKLEPFLSLRGNGLEVLEDSSVRVRIRSRQLGWPQAVVEHTVYPTGRVVISLQGQREDPVAGYRLDSLRVSLGLNANLNWRSEFEKGALMSGDLRGRFEDRWLVCGKNVVPSFHLDRAQGLLLALHGRAKRRIEWEDRPQESLLLSYEVSLRDEACRLAFLVELAAKETKAVLAKQYESPGSVQPVRGQVVRDDKGDWNGDGYNEGEGCFVLKASRRFKLRAGSAGLHDPVIKILKADVQGIPQVLVNGKPLGEAARIGVDTILVRWSARLEPEQVAEVELRD